VDRDWVGGDVGTIVHANFAQAPNPSLDDTDVVMSTLARKKTLDLYDSGSRVLLFGIAFG
jgi:hypothetical protein